MDRLKFGARARRKERLRRAGPWVWAASVVAMVLGVPGSNVGADVLARLGLDKAQLKGVETTESAAGLMKFRGGTFQIRPVEKPAPSPEPEAEPETEAEAAAPAPPVAPAGSIAEIIYAAAAEYGLSGEYLLAVASCESGLNPNAVNAAGYYGLFQFGSGTWATEGYGSIYDPVAQARTAARMLAEGQASRWPNCA
ncbi:MAG: transglycosylase SLT domain-containing protein [Actinomycetota bacterium]|nr:transglycosylase SLT domain-containing protein [Actinomycetota bacterium]